MACLELMLSHGARLGFDIEAVSLNHGLRAEAADEIALISRYCAARDVPHTVLDWAWDGVGNLQARAREARYGLIGAWAVARGIDCIALGHTRDDVAEGFLMRLARQAGVDGLARMDQRFSRAGVTWTRPLLDLGRAELRDYLTRQNLRWAEDPSNADPAFERVRARAALDALPLGLDTPGLASVAQMQGAARDALDHYTRAEAARHVIENAGDLILPASADIPEEVLFRLRRAALRWVGGDAYPPRREAMGAMADALAQGSAHTLAGCRISAEPDGTSWRVTRELATVSELSGARDALWDGRWEVSGPEGAFEIRALGEAVRDTDWRAAALPRASLEASPALWDGPTLVAAPVAGFGAGWTARATGRGNFLDFLGSR